MPTTRCECVGTSCPVHPSRDWFDLAYDVFLAVHYAAVRQSAARKVGARAVVCSAVFVSMVVSAPATAQEAAPIPAHEHASDVTAPLFAPRETSGTAWAPDTTPMLGWHGAVADWQVMVHGNAFGQFLYESGEDHRRGQQGGSINWLMGMARRQVGAGMVGARAMLSFEPWTIGGCGYPNLLATGEVCGGDSIHDKQHPHDLFMEVAGEYTRPLTDGFRWFVYGGPAGEPALGPPGFPHRASAFPNPIAPIGHHWLDSTHITFGLVTTGIDSRRWKVEGAAFNGREPDADRKGFDLAAFDSLSGRVSMMASPGLTFQMSAAKLGEAEAGVSDQPCTDVSRATASATYHRQSGDRGWASTVGYGVNSEVSIIPGALLPQTSHAVLLESSVIAGERYALFGRLEVVGKPAHDLHAHEFITSTFTVGKLQAGYTHYVARLAGMVLGPGVVVSATAVPPLLAPRYSGPIAPGVGVFLAVRPIAH